MPVGNCFTLGAWASSLCIGSVSTDSFNDQINHLGNENQMSKQSKFIGSQIDFKTGPSVEDYELLNQAYCSNYQLNNLKENVHLSSKNKMSNKKLLIDSNRQPTYQSTWNFDRMFSNNRNNYGSISSSSSNNLQKIQNRTKHRLSMIQKHLN
ncbi:hypothetical protein O181_086521 [Austropuccinia psidii MF-1]|uniref:Uncharacterized protein n=1 Tax=Austropuccinia psidii MF-1 TaxID=1389203 RepID=A0A9Q3IKR5_9BASI|nr:hypothetical protein [Austropuccinia psidii MF-1]